MVNMIPSEIAKSTKSAAERRFYAVLKELDLGKKAYAIHDLSLPGHEGKSKGEIDFVIICSMGIACLEVKGGGIRRRDGIWYGINKSGKEHEKIESPEKQCSDNMYNLEKWFNTNVKIDKRIEFIYGLVFPDISFNKITQDIPKERVYDKDTEDAAEYLRVLFEYSKKGKYKNPDILTPAEIEKIVGYIIADFDYAETLDTKLGHAEEKIIKLTENQKNIVNMFSQNKHLLVNGVAGTGKSIVAAEYASKCISSGKKVLFLAYNKNIVRSIKSKFNGRDNIKVTGLHDLFAEYVGLSKDKMSENAAVYYNELLPKEFNDYLHGLDKNELEKIQYDVVVIDEAQDILKLNYIESIDFMLKGGIEKGQWAIFYDNRQNIYNSELDQGLEMISLYEHTDIKLTYNCRNTFEIADFNSKLTDTELPDFMGDAGGEEVRVMTYADEAEFENEVSELIKLLREEKIPLEEVVFLSFHRYERSVLSRLKSKKLKFNIVDENYISQKNVPAFSTVHSFKGLDAKAVVLVIEPDKKTDDKWLKNLLYIACSRARTMLCVITTREFEKQYINK